MRLSGKRLKGQIHGAEVQGEGAGIDEAVSEQTADVKAELMLEAKVTDQHSREVRTFRASRRE